MMRHEAGRSWTSLSSDRKPSTNISSTEPVFSGGRIAVSRLSDTSVSRSSSAARMSPRVRLLQPGYAAKSLTKPDRHRNAVENQGTAAINTKPAKRATRYGHIAPRASSGETPPILHAR